MTIRINDNPDDRICRDFQDLKDKITVYARDMHIQGRQVSFKRLEGRKVGCPETGLTWVVIPRL